MVDFLIIGAQKGGTTSLHEYLRVSPSLFLPEVKEVHFFDLNHDRGDEWYHRHFVLPDAGGRVLKGESTPYYLYHLLIPKRVFEYNPGMKLIALLRHPEARAVSHYFHSLRHGLEMVTDMEKAFALEKERISEDKERIARGVIQKSYSLQHHSYVDRSLYAPQLAGWLEFFPERQLLLIRSEDFFREPGPVLDSVAEFLETDLVRPSSYPVWNGQSYPQVSCSTLESNRPLFEKDQEDIRRMFPAFRGWY